MTKGKVKVGADNKSSHTQTAAFHVAWDKESGDNETKMREKRRFARTRRRTAASAAKETAEAKRKRQSVAKICAAAEQQRKSKKVKEQKIRTSFSSCYKKHEINALKWKNRRHDFRSLKVTDGMQCYWTRFGDLPNQNFGRHITNTYTWVQENTTTNTELEFCWIRNGVITTMIVANHQSIMLVSVYFFHSGYADHHIEKCTEQLRSTRVLAERAYRLLEETSTLIWGLGLGVERVSVGPHSFKEGSKRGDWLKQWLMIHNFHSTQHDEQKRLESERPTDLVQGPSNKSTTSWSREDTWNTLRRWSQRHDPHGQWPQMCHGNISPSTPKKNAHPWCKQRQT